MPKLTIDGREVEVEAGLTILQACDQIGIEIPRFCYHERLSIAGNCRMCLVEMERAPKPVAACSMPVGEGMVIYTNTETVRKARRGVMEFLLINHPLDCPICDQGGECDLQDQAVAYGIDKGRYQETRRAVKEKDFGPLIAPVMTRCIHCTRCIRFSSEIAGVAEMGATFRGEHMEVGTYVEKALTSELSGNLIDVCPVGALTSRPYSFSSRPWELKHIDSIDVLDAVGSNIRVDVRGAEVKRITPRLNEDVNEEWISDKTRFSYDGLRRQRIDAPYVRENGRLRPASWSEAFSAIADQLKSCKKGEIAALAGDLADCESMAALKLLMESLGSPNMDCRQDGAAIDPSCRAGYLFNTTIAGIEEADAILLVGTNPRTEAAILNARIRKRWVDAGIPIGVIGPAVNLNYPYEHLGEDLAILKQFARGRGDFAKVLKSAKKPMMIIGQGALTRGDGAALLALVRKVAESRGMIDDKTGWNGFNVLHTAAARVGGLDLGFVPGKKGLDTIGILDGATKGKIKFVYLLGADEIPIETLGKAFVVYQGHHGDAGAMRADVVLPGAAYTEKFATYVNTEGRVQQTRRAVSPPGDAREDWKIIRALSEVIGNPIAVDTLEDVREALVSMNAIFANVGGIEKASWGDFGAEGDLVDLPVTLPVENFYMTDPITRTSEIMATCTETFGTAQPQERKTGTDA